MEFEFDKEIDAILRKARHGEVVTSAGSHLDADEISAFAENAVPDAARQRFTSHLADCARCRKILSNVIVFNAEAETETAASSAVPVETAETKTPWYRKLFVFPQLAYAMGGLVLLFSGFFGYLILRNLPGAGSSEVSYSTNTAAPAMEKSAPQAASNSNAATNSSVPATNSSVQANTALTTNSAPVPSSNTAAAATPSADKKAVAPDSNSPVESIQPTIAPQPTPPPPDALTGNAQPEELAKTSPAAPTAGAAAQNRAKEDRQKSETKDAARSDDNEIVTAERDESKLKSMPMPKTAKKQTSNAGETRSAGGKTFNNVGGIWFDSAVGKQKQKTVRRGTSEYRKLDAGLRSIADSLGGTVVILWNGKAYRIQ